MAHRRGRTMMRWPACFRQAAAAHPLTWKTFSRTAAWVRVSLTPSVQARLPACMIARKRPEFMAVLHVPAAMAASTVMPPHQLPELTSDVQQLSLDELCTDDKVRRCLIYLFGASAHHWPSAQSDHDRPLTDVDLHLQCSCSVLLMAQVYDVELAWLAFNWRVLSLASAVRLHTSAGAAS